MRALKRVSKMVSKKEVKSTSNKYLVSLRKEPSYDKDFYKWTISQAALLKKGKLDKIDIANLVEEIESLGKSDKRSLKSHLTNLLMHMLKVKYQHEKHTPSWNSSISNARYEIKLLIEDSPSLKTVLKNIFNDSYEDARKKAAEETQISLKTFPKKCPWKIEEVLPK